MPYRWTHSPAAGASTAHTATELHLWPYRSLPRKGFVTFIVIFVTLISLPLFAVLGRVALWWLLPFIMATVAGVWWAISASYRTGEVREVLSFSPQKLHLTRHDPGRAKARDWEANPHWVRVEMHAKGGPVPDYLTLLGGPREVEIGAFLTPEERRTLHNELTRQLAELRAPGQF
ncbi:DUF2244 domain-containing protein [uncultured Thioclava sp.]|uniref:DUF2244 domain-containing protein n=1 Tax=uncultured Thioclava sp. TaxID=473858 RepID=UPI0025D9B5E4|nr:DUF2244 domain-containing protein [uncultured Thioclava sp.]